MSKPMKNRWRVAALVPFLALAGCVSLGGAEPPDSLLTLTPEVRAAAGDAYSGTRAETLAVHVPETTAAIDVRRIPVQVDDATIAYVTDAVWVEKPAHLFRRVVAETIRVETGQLVIDGDDPSLFADSHLRGTLREFGYDARSSSVIVRFDAIKSGEDGMVETRRFEAIEQGIGADALPISAALNRASNDVARQIAAWLKSPATDAGS